MSCKFCYKLGENKDKVVLWQVRSCMAEQNVEDYNEVPSEWDGKHRQIDREWFELVAYKHRDDTTSVSVEYRMETDDGLIINPFSEAIEWSFCPFCDEKLGKNIIKADDIYKHQFDVEDEDYDLAKALHEI